MDLLLSESLLDEAPCGFLSFADDGTMLAINRTLAEMLGYTRVALQGWHLQKLLAPGARVFYSTHVFPILKMHGVAEEIYIALRTKHGTDVPVLLNAVRRERGGTTVNDCVFMRMLQRHKFEAELIEARRIAEQASSAKAKFLSMMSHDIRTPLTAISGHAELLASGDTALDDEQRESVTAIRESARDLGRLVDDILSFAQLESGRVTVRPQPVMLSTALARAEVLIRLRVSEAQLTFSTARCALQTAVSADPDRLQQILLNLLTNAIKFTPADGSISVECESLSGRVAIRVRDSGVGIPREELERIFDPFVQLPAQPTDATLRGVGLGLAISRDLARAMGGELTADSVPGAGSVFTLELPRAATESVPA